MAKLLSMHELLARPCEVDGVPALFHRWVEEDRAVLRIEVLARGEKMGELHRCFHDSGVVPPGCSVDVLRETFALVEYRDGTIAKVDPVLVRFVGKEDRE